MSSSKPPKPHTPHKPPASSTPARTTHRHNQSITTTTPPTNTTTTSLASPALPTTSARPAQPVFLSLTPSSFASLVLTAHNFFHVSVGRVHGRLMALPVVLDCHASLLVPAGGAGGGGGGAGSGVVSGSAVLGRLFAQLPSLIADVNVAKLKNAKEKPNLLETDKILFTYQFRETHSKYHVMTLVPPHSSAPRLHYPDLDSEGDISSDDLRDHDSHSDDDAASDEHSRQRQQRSDDDEGGYYGGGKYRAFQVSKHSLYVRAIARYRHDDTHADEHKDGAASSPADEVGGQGREGKARGKDEERREDQESSASERKTSKREKEAVGADEEVEEEEEESRTRRKHRRVEKGKSDKRSSTRRRSVTVLDDDDDFV